MAGAADVFVSYKAEDRARVGPLVDALQAEGFSVWWDSQIGGGTNWHEDIEQHLDAAKCVIVAWSKRSIGRHGHFVRDEARRAQRRNTYLPVRLDRIDPPLGFGEIQALPLIGWKGDTEDPRFTALAETVRSYLSGEHITHVPIQAREARVSRRTVVVGGVGVTALAATGGWLLLRPAPANANRIAVMPFANLSGDPNQAYFAEGIAEELRSSLSRIGLEVIGRASSYAVKDLETKVAAAKLNVSNILTGSVRRSSELVRVDTELVSGDDGVERWAKSYDRAPGDAIKIQTEIAEDVAGALSFALDQAGRAAITLGGTTDSVADDLILQSRQLGRNVTGAEALRKRIALADAAIIRDPKFARAYVEKTYALIVMAGAYTDTAAEVAKQLEQAEASAQKAVELAPKLGSAHLALANVAIGRMDFRGVLQQTEESLALSPNDPDLVQHAAQFLTWFKSADLGARLADRAIELDPLHGTAYQLKCETLIYLRQYAKAIEIGRKALALAPDRHDTYLYTGDAFLLLGKISQAKIEYEAQDADDSFRVLRLALLAARSGDRVGADRLMTESKLEMGATASYQFGEIYAQLGDLDRAFAEFDNAIQARDNGLAYLKVDPFVDPIRSDPRYAALLRRLNFP